MSIDKFVSQRFNFILAISSFLIFMGLIGCSLNTSVLDPDPTIRPVARPISPVGEEGPPGSSSADAFPGYACPADNITLQWNVGDPMCPTRTGLSCQTLTATDTLGLLTPPFTSRDLTGTHVNGSVKSLGSSWSGANPVFTFSVAHDDATDPGWINTTSEVVIVQNPPVESTAVNFKVFSTTCNRALGWGLSHYRLDMAHQDFIDATKGLGDCLIITSVCYEPDHPNAKRPDPVEVSLVGGGSMSARPLSLGDCVDGLSLKPNRAYDVTPATAVIPMHEGNCVPGDVEGAPVTDPPFTQLLFTFGCDTTLNECGN